MGRARQRSGPRRRAVQPPAADGVSAVVGGRRDVDGVARLAADPHVEEDVERAAAAEDDALDKRVVVEEPLELEERHASKAAWFVAATSRSARLFEARSFEARSFEARSFDEGPPRRSLSRGVPPARPRCVPGITFAGVASPCRSVPGAASRRVPSMGNARVQVANVRPLPVVKDLACAVHSARVSPRAA